MHINDTAYSLGEFTTKISHLIKLFFFHKPERLNSSISISRIKKRSSVFTRVHLGMLYPRSITDNTINPLDQTLPIYTYTTTCVFQCPTFILFTRVADPVSHFPEPDPSLQENRICTRQFKKKRIPPSNKTKM